MITSHTRPNGKVAYTVTEPKDVGFLPYHYLVAVSDISEFTEPQKALVLMPHLFSPMSIL